MGVSSTSPTNQININNPSNLNYGQYSVLSGKIENLCATVSQLSNCLTIVQSKTNNPSCCDLQGTTTVGNKTSVPFSLIDVSTNNNIIIGINKITSSEYKKGQIVIGESFNDNTYGSIIIDTPDLDVGVNLSQRFPKGQGVYTLSASYNGGDPILADVNGNINLGTLDINNYTEGTGISIISNVITNTSPDRIVSLTGTGSTSVTGAYPNFTINSVDTNTTYTAGTGSTVTFTLVYETITATV